MTGAGLARLWIMRHGEAEPRAASDAERPLTPSGWRQARAAGRWLRTQPEPPRYILASPFRRAAETASAVAEALALPVSTSGLLVPDADPAMLLDWLEQQLTGILMVSHQPLVSAFAGLLLDGRPAAGPPLGTGSVAIIDGDPLGLSCGRLSGLMHAPELLAMPDGDSCGR